MADVDAAVAKDVSDAGGAPRFQLDGGLKFQGRSSSTQLLERPGRLALLNDLWLGVYSEFRTGAESAPITASRQP